MEWTEFEPVMQGVGPGGVSTKTHEIQWMEARGIWQESNWQESKSPCWWAGDKYRYRLRTLDLTQLSDADLDAQAQAIEAERKRRDDDLGQWLELLAEMLGSVGFPDWAGDLRKGVIREADKTAARVLRDHTRRAVDEALKAVGHG